MSIHKTQAIVMERRDYRETSYLLNLLTPDFGRISAQAKGARRYQGKFGTNFLPLTCNTVIFYDTGKTDLHIISQADQIEHFGGITKDIKKFAYAAYFVELVNSTSAQGEKNVEIFDLLMNFLNFLDKEDRIEHIVQIFEIKFLSLSGFKPRLDCCVHCDREITQKSRFSFIFGGLLCPECFAMDHSAQSVLKGTIATITHIENSELKRILNFRIVASVSRELEKILRCFIDFHLGGQFNSLKFLKKMRFVNV